MTKFLAAAAIAAVTLAAPLAAQSQDHGAHAEQAAAARLNLDTPVEVILADAAGKAVLDAALPGLAAHEQYDSFKQFGLRQLANYAPDKLTPDLLAKVEAELAKIK